MPEVGEVRRAKEIGKGGKNWFVWQGCLDCGNQRWIQLRENGRRLRCVQCAARNPDRIRKQAQTKISHGIQMARAVPLGTIQEPQVGDIRRGDEIGKNSRGQYYIWHPCPKCLKPRWVLSAKGIPTRQLCKRCAETNPERTRKVLASKLDLGYIQNIAAAVGTIEEPKAGDVRSRDQLNGHNQKSKHLCVWKVCPICGNGRWASIFKNGRTTNRCIHCRWEGEPKIGLGSAGWKGGRVVDRNGYVKVWIDPSDPFHAMCLKGTNYVLEHRLVMARHLGRLLKSWEQPHHIDLDRGNNDISNLELKMVGHGKGTTGKWNLASELEKAKDRIAELEARVTIIEAENALLKAMEV